jgi:hypothetical protein
MHMVPLVMHGRAKHRKSANPATRIQTGELIGCESIKKHDARNVLQGFKHDRKHSNPSIRSQSDCKQISHMEIDHLQIHHLPFNTVPSSFAQTRKAIHGCGTTTIGMSQHGMYTCIHVYLYTCTVRLSLILPNIRNAQNSIIYAILYAVLSYGLSSCPCF